MKQLTISLECDESGKVSVDIGVSKSLTALERVALLTVVRKNVEESINEIINSKKVGGKESC